MAYNPQWTIYIGADFEQRFQIQTRDSDNALQNVDITGATFACKLRSTRTSTTVVATASVAIATAASGTIDVTIPNATTGALSEGVGEWDLFMTLSSEVTLIAAGRYTILERFAR